MAVETCMDPKFMVEDSDDEEPLVFSRRKATPVPPEVKNSLPAGKPDRHPGKQGLGSGVALNDRSSSALKGKSLQGSKPSSSRSFLGSQKSPPPPSRTQKSPSPSSMPQRSPPSSTRPSPNPPSCRASPVTTPFVNGTSSANHQPKKDAAVPMIEERRSPIPVKELNRPPVAVKKENPYLVKKERQYYSESEDSDDDRPLSSRRAVVPQKREPKMDGQGKPSNGDSEDSDDEKPLSARIDKGRPPPGASQNQKLKATVKPSDDSDDERPLSSKYQIKSNAGTSKHDDSDELKPLSSKLNQNGIMKKASVTPAKRPSTETSSGQSLLKKMKQSDLSSSAKAKQVPGKSGTKDDVDLIPVSQRMSKAASTSGSKSVPVKKAAKVDSSKLKKINKKSKKIIKKSQYSRSSKELPTSGDGQKWTTLIHSGVIFPPLYQPHGVKILYDGKPVALTPEQEEVATMYAVMLETDYIKKDKFNENFFADWKKLLGKNHVIQELSRCDFTPIHEWHLREKEKKKLMSTEEKKALKEEKLKQEEKYMWAIVDGVKEKVGNFRVEPPGLFRGRGEHPKMGKLKKRIYPRDITINIGKDAPVPECPMPGQRWKEVRHDNTVTWLAYWNDPINPKEFKYVFLAASSSWKGQSDMQKYEKARKLKDCIDGIRKAYRKDFTSKDRTKRQIAVATYLIDILALRAGNEKDDDEADTVGCCTLKVENVKPKPPHTLEFDFLGKDSIRYQKDFVADPLVYKAVEQFRQGKRDVDDLFDELDTSKLNAHLKELMPGLTAKVFRTFNASHTLDEKLFEGTAVGEVPQKIAKYNEANKLVAIICNHQRTVSKSHTAQMERLTAKINELKDELSDLESDLARAKKGKPPSKGRDGKQKRNLTPEAIEKKIHTLRGKIEKSEMDMQSKEDLKEIALGTSKINYLDPRITVAWCKRNEVPIEKLFNKSLLAKFSWAMDCDPDFRF